MHHLKNFSSKMPLIRGAVLAAAGSGLAWHVVPSDYNVSGAVSVPPLAWDSLILPWSALYKRNALPFLLCSFPQHGVSPVFLSSMSDVPDPVRAKGAVIDPGGCPNHSCNCLGRDTFADVAKKVGPAVVNISTSKSFFGRDVGKGIGSGTIIDEDGTILTCAHVVVDPQGLKLSPKVEVTLHDGRSFEGIVVSADLHYDVAVVKIKSKTPLPFAKLGSSSKLCPGDWVAAMGCPHTLQNTITAGIISFVGRKSTDLGLEGVEREYLQADCAINHGNSGGPLVNIDGEVVGISVMKVSGADGLSFALPIDSALKIVEQFKRNGRVVQPWLGMRMIELNDMLVAQLKEANPSFPDVSSGVLVNMVSPGSPADRAGFRPGDVVTEFGGRPIANVNEVIEAMDDKVGKPFKAVVRRGRSAIQTLTVTPEESRPRM